MKPKKSSKKQASPTPRSESAASNGPEKKAPGKSAAGTSSTPEPQNPAPKTPGRKPLKIPAILLEGDKPSAPVPSGPGQRYALGPKAPVERLEGEGELPESYGTRQLLLAARDPYWLYAHWDLTREQQRHFNSISIDHHLILRVYLDTVAGKPRNEIHVHPESRHWFIPVDRAGAKYVAELGYYGAASKWTTISTSSPTLTPPDTLSSETSAEFATIPLELPMEKLLELVKEAVRENVPVAEALQELRAQGYPKLPPSVPPGEWTPAQERALAEVISMDRVRRVWMGSLEITELIRRQFVNELASMAAAGLAGGAAGAPTSPMGISSPFGGGQPGKGFWFNVNAELIVYGATEPNATVMIGGRRIKLRPDGSFSYRFALPDGQYEMPIVAISADETDGRAAELKFQRTTEYRGDVGAHPQDPELEQLHLENF
jgi:hypothetical protein